MPVLCAWTSRLTFRRSRRFALHVTFLDVASARLLQRSRMSQVRSTSNVFLQRFPSVSACKLEQSLRCEDQKGFTTYPPSPSGSYHDSFGRAPASILVCYKRKRIAYAPT